MENEKSHFQEKSSDEPRWKNVVNIDEILSKIGPEGCHELAEKLVEVANEDVQSALEQAQKLNTLENEVWFKHPKEPFLNTAVVVELDNGELGIAQLDDDSNRKCWLIQGSGKLFWRSMFEKVEKWRWMTADEMVEYHVDRTLKIVEDDR
ncbi:MAG: hypothetical protein DRN27_09230 [Thermoplasmata archaeon]|nr:MAG: hypothetical protein DRN27_09230 [Thermoplasmata archaeon]